MLYNLSHMKINHGSKEYIKNENFINVYNLNLNYIYPKVLFSQLQNPLHKTKLYQSIIIFTP